MQMQDDNIVPRLPSSCRDLVFESMCSLPNVIASIPMSWNSECVKGICKGCPNKIKLVVPQNVQKMHVKFSVAF